MVTKSQTSKTGAMQLFSRPISQDARTSAQRQSNKSQDSRGTSVKNLRTTLRQSKDTCNFTGMPRVHRAILLCLLISPYQIKCIITRGWLIIHQCNLHVYQRLLSNQRKCNLVSMEGEDGECLLKKRNMTVLFCNYNT